MALPIDITSEDNYDMDGSEFFHFMQMMSDDLLFRFDIRRKIIRFYGKSQQLLGLPKLIDNYPTSMFETGRIAEADFHTFMDSVVHMANGEEVSFFFRAYTEHEQLQWYKQEYKLRLSSNGIPLEAIGKVTNVQTQKELEERANVDPLTGCLRKNAFELLISTQLSDANGKNHALFAIDLDHFKAVNDNLGHQFGDMVLKDVGEKLRSIFRSNDLVARMGGDEFMVLMQNVPSVDIVKVKAEKILAALDTTFKGTTTSYRVTSSVGISLFPQDGDNFETLYRYSDMALFESKNSGKNRYSFYHAELSKGTMENDLPYEIANRTIAQYFDQDIASEVFNLLFETKDYDISIQAILELLGKRFHVSRSYIFERHPHLLDNYVNSYEWCNRNATPEIDNLQEVPSSILQEFFRQANEGGIFYCNDLNHLSRGGAYEIMEPQNIKSFVHAYIYSGDQVAYVLGFDDCEAPRIWTPIEVSTILYTAKIIAQFLGMKNILVTAETVARERMSVLDSLNFFSYIIDANTFDLTYCNKYTKNAIPDLHLGEKCYRTIRGREEPCANCPLHIMRSKNQKEATVYLFNEMLRKNTLVKASKVEQFDGRESVFVSSIIIGDSIKKQIKQEK